MRLVDHSDGYAPFGDELGEPQNLLLPPTPFYSFVERLLQP
ncbi:MAG: hypothetical protein OXC44_08400 [Proteobacteria bacterium]|nr:hypothetical protein [Pseudomonadota bacterium]